MAIDEDTLEQLHQDIQTEYVSINTQRTELKELYQRVITIKMTSRTQVTPAVVAVPAVMDDDGTTITTPAVAAIPEKTEQVFDVKPIDKNLDESMDDTRRQEIYDSIVAKKASLGF